jgi:hypothetical protein
LIDIETKLQVKLSRATALRLRQNVLMARLRSSATHDEKAEACDIAAELRTLSMEISTINGWLIWRKKRSGPTGTSAS